MLLALSKAKKAGLLMARKWWILLPLVAAGVGFSAWKQSQIPPAYSSVARMMVSGRIALPDGAVYSEELNNFYGTQIELMQSATIRSRAASAVQAKNPELRSSPVNLSVGQQKGTSFFVLTATGDEPKYTKAFLNACMSEYVQFKREMRTETADTAVIAVTEQLLALDKDLQQGEQDLLEFQKQNNVTFLEEEGNTSAKYLLGLRDQLASLKTEYELLKRLDVDQNIERQRQRDRNGSDTGAASENSGASAAAMSAVGPEANYLEAKQRIELLKSEMERFSKVLKPKHPKMLKLAEDVRQQERLIALYRDQATAQIQTRRASIGLQIENLESEIKETEPRALVLSQKLADYNRLRSKVERTKTMSDKLLSTMQSVDVNKSLGQDVVNIMEPASDPSPTKPGLTKDLLTGGAGGLMIGLAVLAVLFFLDDRVTSSYDIQQASDEELLAQIPQLKSKGPVNLLHPEEKNHVFNEACRNLRSSLLYMNFEGERPKTFLVTSSIPNEGKSTVSVNLAITLAAAGSKTLLVDGDLRRGALNEHFNLPTGPGFSEVLRQQINWQEVITQTEQENLSLISRGKALEEVSELYLSKVTDEFLRQVYDQYDYIIIDSAPVLVKEDTSSLAPKIDATLFVVRAGVTSLRAAKSAMEGLKKRNANLLGIVLNSAPASQSEHQYYYKYADYYAAQN
jgi:capsular exopolysaccharide synthesis family protein